MRQPLRARNTHKILSLVRLWLPVAAGILSDKKNPLASVYYQTKRGALSRGPPPQISAAQTSTPTPPIITGTAPTVCNVASVNQCRFSKSPENFVWVYQYKTGGIEGGMPLFLAGFALLFLGADNFTISPILTVLRQLIFAFLSPF